MTPLARRTSIVLAAFAVVAAADLVCIKVFGEAPRVLDYLVSIVLLGTVALGICVPPLLLADWLGRAVPKPYRVWVWLVFAIVIAAGVLLAVSAVLERSDILV
jgi:hypothetical protein